MNSSFYGKIYSRFFLGGAQWSVIDFSSNILIETFRTVTFYAYDLGDIGRINDSEFWARELLAMAMS